MSNLNSLGFQKELPCAIQLNPSTPMRNLFNRDASRHNLYVRNMFKSDMRLLKEFCLIAKCSKADAKEMKPIIKELGTAIVKKYSPVVDSQITDASYKSGVTAAIIAIGTGALALGVHLLSPYSPLIAEISHMAKADFIFFSSLISSFALFGAMAAYGTVCSTKHFAEEHFWKPVEKLKEKLRV